MPQKPSSPKALSIVNARENNLKEVSLRIPHDELVVLTGLSGSGKSSLAFDTVYAEGQRRYIETFSPYTRQFFDKVKKPDVDTIDHVRPAIAIQQRTRVTGSRSTVGSMTNVNDYLKVLWSNIATPVCPKCHLPMEKWTAPSLALHLVRLQNVRKSELLFLCAPKTLPKDAAARVTEIDRLIALGYNRTFDPKSGSFSSLDELDRTSDFLLIAVDRCKAGTLNRKRLSDSVEQCFNISGGTCVVIEPGQAQRGYRRVMQSDEQENISRAPYELWEYYNTYRCSSADVSVQPARPSLFSFNHPVGACPACKGFGKVLSVDTRLCVPDGSLSIKGGALQCWSGASCSGERRRLFKFCAARGISIDAPWRSLSEADRDLIFSHRSREFLGIIPWFKKREKKAYKMHVRVFLARYRGQFDCPECRGTRLKSDALAYKVASRSLPEIWQMPIDELYRWLRSIREDLDLRGKLPRQLDDLFSAIDSRLKYLIDLGLPYLTLERQARTLSGGETQRVNLATALGSDLISTHFVLDEPSVGLHARDTERLIRSVRDLQAKGNSVLMVEHDLECIAEGDHVIELGPKAGAEGGAIVYEGPAAGWKGVAPQIEIVDSNVVRGKASSSSLIISKARARNLKDLDLSIPLDRFVCLTGVSGSGKSSLVTEVIIDAYRRYKTGDSSHENIVTGFENVQQVLLVDQSPLAKSPRANIATYTGMWDAIRELLAGTDDAKTRALSKSSFSFNVDGGRCPACSGSGFIREDMQFLSDVFIPCETCLGKRFLGPVLEVRYKGKNVSEFLHMSVDECARWFHGNPRIAPAAETLSLLGLGHLTLGHPLSELSGGEAQRLKLVPFVDRSAAGKSLLIFDEPTTGLHVHDVARLITLFRTLRDSGHSVLCVEHNLLLVAGADWIIDLGPEGGEAGGYLVAQGTPSDIAKAGSRSQTGAYLGRFLKHGGRPERVEMPPTRGKTAHRRDVLQINGAREHNLKDIDVSIPLNSVVALTGVSGSGKSSIAKDIIYAEGQRRYLDCLSPFARQFIKELKKPEIDSIHNIQPTICVYQHTFQPSRLSTVATMSEIYNFLRLLFAKTAIQFCPDHPDQAISPLSAREMAIAIKAMRCSQLRVLAPVVKMKKGFHKPVFARALESEMFEVRVDGEFAHPSRFEEGLAKTKTHTIEFVVAKLNPANVDVDMIEDAVRQALTVGGGTLVVNSGGEDTVFSMERTCAICQQGFFKPDPEDLSFNSRRGACEACSGSGKTERGAVCEGCGGARIGPIGRNLRISGKNIFEVCGETPSRLRQLLKSLELSSKDTQLAAPIIAELLGKIETLVTFGLDYIELNRACATLSGGELQRLRLATAIGSPLSGAMYIFDEPSSGLHPLDNRRVLSKIHSLKDKGNSVIVIEHDTSTILSSDYVLEIGPGGGSNGGNVVYSGPTNDLSAAAGSLLASSVSQPVRIEKPRATGQKKVLRIESDGINNIESLDLTMPLHSVVSVAGVSGAGKSSLVHGLLVDTLINGKGKAATKKRGGTIVTSDEMIARVLLVDQKPIGINSRSTPASYLGIWDDIRKLFAGTVEARSRGWGASHFSYNTGKGRCPECKGQGQIKLEMSFLPDAHVECETCGGTRYVEEVATAKYLDHSISDVLALTFEEARPLFSNHPKIHRALHKACELGLGYLTLGQSSSTLSGGESQRIKLVFELSSRPKEHTLYVLDEPTTGLHRSDVARLMKTLDELVSLGHTVVVIEHDPDVVAASDHVIELGPGPGVQGGRVVFEGPPAELTKAKTPWGDVLRELIVPTPRKGGTRAQITRETVTV